MRRPTVNFTALIVIGMLFVPGSFGSSVSVRKQQAAAQYEKAEQMREALNGRPESERTRKDYQRVADAYRKVYYVAPDSSKADKSVVAVAELLAGMGRQFQPGEKDLQSAIKEYEFLRREYPGSKYRFQALFTIGQIYKEDLGDEAAARATFEEFLQHYPRNSLAAEAKRALAELNRPRMQPEKAAEARSPANGPAPLPSEGAAGAKHGLGLVTGVRYWSTPDYTRVAIDVDREVKYQMGRVAGPDRIFFDLPDSKLVSVLVGKSFDVRDGFLKKIRVAQYQPEAVRVVLEVDDVSEYAAFLLPNPYRLIIDIHGRPPQAQTSLARAAPGPEVEEPAANRKTEAAKSSSAQAAGKTDKSNGKAKTPPETAAAAPSAPAAQGGNETAANRSVHKVIVDDSDDFAPGDTRPAATASAAGGGKTSPKAAKAGAPAATSGNNSASKTLVANSSEDLDDDDPLTHSGDAAGPRVASNPTTAPTAVEVAPRGNAKKKSAKASSSAALGHEAAANASGERSLTRALGLKFGRIVIDAGHGGHDTGTIGPNGLTEKELVLDVALRLGRLLETRLGADVIYTRDDDTFVPLETRTAIANERQADLFISVHANSSPDPAARGIETYYLNFTSNPDALEVAARENAVSQKSIFELQDLVKKITLKEKIEESRELASDVQQSLCTGLSPKASSLRDRGVKKAPFVVLIGANMPSILAEISFVSNPDDAARLDTTDYRQRIAEALYKGIARYAGGLSGVRVAKNNN